MCDEPTQADKAAAMQTRDMIVEKLNAYKGEGGTEHESGALFYKLALNLDTKYILQALGALNDRLFNDRRPAIIGSGIDRYFMACMRNICKDNNLKSGIGKWDKELKD